MKQSAEVKRSPRPSPAWLAVPVAVFALLSLDVGIIASRTVPQPTVYATPVLIFSDVRFLKAWLATAALALACFQLLTAAHIYELLRFPPRGRFYNLVHRWSGRFAIALTLPVAYHCIFQLGLDLSNPDTRVVVHSLLGTTIYSTFVCKVLFVRSTRFPAWALPVAGGLLFTIILGLWITSAFWLFGAFGIKL